MASVGKLRSIPVFRIRLIQAAGLLLAGLAFSGQSYAALQLNSATLSVASPAQGPASVVYVKGGGTITADVNLSTIGTTDWSATSWRIGAGAVTCDSATNFTGNNATTTLPITITAPAAAGTYGVSFVAYSNNGCTANASNTLTLTGSIVVDNTAPSASSIVLADANPTSATSVSWTVTFSESVIGVAAGNFALAQAGGLSGAAITSVTGSGTTWTVTASTGTGGGTLGLNLGSATGITDLAGNALTGVPVAGGVYTVNGSTAASVTASPTLCVNDASIGTQPWSGLTNVGAQDNVYAQATGINGQITNYLKCTAYNFSIPAGATIDGITVGPWMYSAKTMSDQALQLVKANVIQPSNLATLTRLPGTNTQVLYGGASNLWGNAWTAADINNAGFGAAFAAVRGPFNTTDTAFVDYMPITIDYTLPLAPLAEYRMDEALWNGTAGEVLDNTGNGNNAQAFNSAGTDGTTPAIAGNPGTCRYGVFDNGGSITQGYVQTPLPNFTSDFTITAWIRTTNNAIAGQRILIDDQSNSGGYGFSLGDGAAGRLRLYSRSISPIILDSTYTIANNVWYFVAAVIDISNRLRTIYVFDSAGALLGRTSDPAAFTGTWGTDAGPVSIGGETNASGEPPASFHFHGNIDEVRVYQQALSQAAVTAIATQTHPCAAVVAVPNHYELSMPTSSVACLPTTVTVTACTDASSPCTNPFAGASGTTAVLGASGGTLGAPAVTFGATGVASTTLSYPAAPNGTPVVVSLSAEQIAASNPRQWCPNGSGCVAANSGTTTFNTAGFIVSASAGGAVAAIPAQVAGITSAANYLRAVKTNSTTQACEPALTGTNPVNIAYECNNPATCYATNLMSVNGGSATTIARNNSGSVSSYLPVSMSFDANGNAPFTFNYSDAGLVKLWASKAAGGALLSALTGSSNSFVVKPHHFDIANIACTTVGAGTCAPANVTGNNPAASGPGGAAFIQAGQPFKATVTAMNGAPTPAFTPSFGKETPAEGAQLLSFNHLPGAGNAAAINRVLSGFNAGAATLTDLSWSEVGVLQLQATLSNASGYLGSDTVNGRNSVVSTTNPYVGRFIPDHFDTVVTPQGGGFAYSGNPVGPVPGQPFTVTVTARNASALATANYYNAGGYARNINLSVPFGGATGQLYVDAVAGGSGAVPAGRFVNANPGEGKVNYSDASGKVSFVFNSLPYYLAPPIQIHAEDADTVASSGANGSINIRHGRLRMFNAFGSELANLSLPLQAEYWSGNSWVLNSDDSFTVIPAGSVALSGYLGTLSAANLGAGHVAGTALASGLGSIVLALPAPTATGSVDLAIDLGNGAVDQSCLTVHPAATGAAIPWLRSINGNCASTYDRDPSARASFGIYAPETKRTIHVRELF